MQENNENDILKKIVTSEIFLYVFVGGLTTLVSIASFSLLVKAFNTANQATTYGWKLAEMLSFVIAVAFAFFANKMFVFKSVDFTSKVLFKQVAGFVGARIFSEVINFVIMWVMIDKKGYNEFLTKILASVVVVILNYGFSKFIIFKKSSDVQKQ